MSEDAPRIVGDVIGKLSLGPRDILVVKSSRPLNDEMARRIFEFVRSKLPADVQCLVIDSTIDLAILTRTEIEARAA